MLYTWDKCGNGYNFRQQLESCIRLEPVVNEELSYRMEEGNISDPYAVAIVGHMPRQIFNKDIMPLIEYKLTVLILWLHHQP